MKLIDILERAEFKMLRSLNLSWYYLSQTISLNLIVYKTTKHQNKRYKDRQSSSEYSKKFVNHNVKIRIVNNLVLTDNMQNRPKHPAQITDRLTTKRHYSTKTEKR